MTQPLNQRQTLLLGSTVVVAVGLGILGLFAVGTRGWYGSNALTVQVHFPDVRGVEAGTRVRIRGVDAGEVAAIEPSEDDGEVRVQLRIHNRFRKQVKAGSTVRIVGEGLLGGKVLEISPPKSDDPNAADHELVENGAVLKSEKSGELNDLVGQLGQAVENMRDGKGSLGKFLKDPEAFDAVVDAARSIQEAATQGKDALAAGERAADAVKNLPFIGRHVINPQAILGRTNGEWNTKIFKETDLFEPNRAVLTTDGKRHLDTIAPWIAGLKHKGSEVVIASYANPNANREAPAVTLQQSEAIALYLKREHNAHKLGWVSTRRVIPLGMGGQTPPAPHNRENRSTPRIEVMVFVPQS